MLPGRLSLDVLDGLARAKRSGVSSGGVVLLRRNGLVRVQRSGVSSCGVVLSRWSKLDMLAAAGVLPLRRTFV